MSEMVSVEIGWQVLDPEGNVVESGPVVVAEMTAETAEKLGLLIPERT